MEYVSMMTNLQLVVPTLFGLEGLAAEELRRLSPQTYTGVCKY